MQHVTAATQPNLRPASERTESSRPPLYAALGQHHTAGVALAVAVSCFHSAEECTQQACMLRAGSRSSSSSAIAPALPMDRLSTRQATIHWRLQLTASSLTCTALPASTTCTTSARVGDPTSPDNGSLLGKHRKAGATPVATGRALSCSAPAPRTDDLSAPAPQH